MPLMLYNVATAAIKLSAFWRSICPPLIRSLIPFCFDAEDWQRSLLRKEEKKNNST